MALPHVLLLLLPLPAQDPPDVGNLQRLREARDWPALAEAARAAREELEPGGTEWILASADLVRADWELGGPLLSEIERVALEVLGRFPEEPQPVELRARERVVLFSGLSQQARGRHERALDALGPLLVEPPLLADPRTWARAELAAVDCLRSLDRKEEADRLLVLVAMRWESLEGAVAQARLTARGGPYLGRYREDEGHAELREACLRAVPRALERVRAWYPFAGTVAEEVIVGLADRPTGAGPEPVVLIHDPRRPSVPPVLVVFTEGLERDALDPEPLLAAALARAALAVRLGPRFEELPPWLVEGVGRHVAGTLADAERHALERRFLLHGELVLERRRYWRRFPVPLDAREASLQVRTGVGEGLDRLVELLWTGSDLEEACEVGLGEDVASFTERATTALQRRMKRAVSEARPVLRRLVEDGAGGTVGNVGEVLEEPRTPFETGCSRLALGRALMELGRWEEALGTWDALLAERRLHPDLVETALARRAGALLALGREDEAREALQLVGRTTTSERVREWAGSGIEALGR